MKNIILIFFCLFLSTSLYAQPDKAQIKCTLKGEVIDRPQSTRLKAVKSGDDFRLDGIDIDIKDGKFEHTIYCDIEEAYEIAFEDELMRGSWRSATFYTEDTVVTMQLFPFDRYMENTVNGGKLNSKNKEYMEFKNNLFSSSWEENDKEWEKLSREDRLQSVKAKEIYKLLDTDDDNVRDSLYREIETMRETGDDFTAEGKQLKDKTNELSKREYEWELEYFAKNVSLVGYNNIIRRLLFIKNNPVGENPYIELYNNVYKDAYPNHPYTAKVADMVKALTSVKKGGRYIDFSAPDFNGNKVTLSDKINGKIALIDLWASWCGPCRRTSKSMIPIYEDFKDKGFTILAVARETSLSNAVNAYQKDGYTWLSLIDLNDENRVWEKYGVGNAGGATFLVDCDGTILAVHPTAAEVRSILEEKLK